MPAPLERDGCGFVDSVRDVVMVVSSSRSGSSFLMELLSWARGLVQLQGEPGPILRNAKLDPWSTGIGCDVLDASHCTPAVARAISGALEREVGSRARSLEGASLDLPRFVRAIRDRLALQWIGEDVSAELIGRAVEEALVEVHDPQRFTALLLRRLRRDHPRIHPHYYDLPGDVIASVFPGLDRPLGPPSPDALLEEPPFLCFVPWAPIGVAGMTSRTLVLKSPSNAYRLPFFEALFPRARLRLLHLTRNPAAAINGLIDGWLFRGFHSHRMARPLEIPGYADVRPEDASWWKFDLPPGWEAWTGRPLADVCGFQWCAAHEAVLRFAHAQDVPYLRVRFEDLVGGPETAAQTVEGICRWLEIDAAADLVTALASGIPAVMGTQAPRRRRWTERAGELGAVLADEHVRRVAGLLGYDDMAAWI